MSKPFTNILVPIDGSSQSRTAQEMAIFTSKLFRPQVTLIHVVSNELPALAGEIYSPREDTVPVNPATIQFPRAIVLPKPRENILPEGIIEEVTQRLRENGRTMLNESSSLFKAEGIEAKQKLVEATRTAEAIINEAEAGKYDLIIMGNSGGEEKEPDLHLGSVAKKVSQSVKTPVMIVRRKKEIRRILVPVDGSPEEEKAIEKAVMIAKAAKSGVLLLHAQERAFLKLKPEISEVGLQILNRASTLLEGVAFEQKLASGDPAKTIIETAEDSGIDLIVLRGGTLGTLKGAFLGSVSDHVIQHATVPVLLLK